MAEQNSPVVFSADGLSVSYGNQVVLKNSSLSVYEKERIGLVGRNGCGKSTFLKIVAGIEKPDTGNVIRKKGLTMSYLSQDFTIDPSKSVYESVLDGASNITDLIKEYENLPSASKEQHIIENKIKMLDGWNLKNKIERVIQAVNAPAVDKKVSELSGGERRRTSLAKAIIGEPDLLILDEPTNHLDTDSVEWLEKYIESYNGTVIFVTHDRYFLDNLATRVVELANGNFYSYPGSYSDYLIGKARRIEIEEKAEHKRKSFIRREISWIRRMPKARVTKSYSRVDRFNQAVSQLPPEKELDMELIIPPPRQLSDKVAEFTNVSISYGDNLILKEFNFLINPGMKIGLIGKNGTGKTSFLKALTGELLPSSGTIERASNLEFNYIDQERLKLNEANSVYEEISGGYDFIKLGNETVTIWTYLKRFLFEDSRIRTRISELSGGEKGRLILAKILKNGGNFLILDEPTNDLDLQTLRILEESLLSFAGCVMLVSHDRYFLNRVCSSILAFEEKKLNYYVGNYDYYFEKKQSRSTQANTLQKQKEKAPIPLQKSLKIGTRKLKWSEEKELETIENNVIETEERIAEIEKTFGSQDFFEKHGNKSQELQTELDSLKIKLESLYNRWNELERIKNG